MPVHLVQLRKEACQLLLPWAVTMLLGLISLLHIPQSGYSWSPIDLLNWVVPLGCFVGVPLLAALPLGSEFQQGTLTLLLAQPVDRDSVWRQKMLITLAAVLPASFLYLFSFYRSLEYRDDFWMAAVWIVAATAGSIAGSLLARSTIGGLALSSAFYGIGFVAWSRLGDSYRKNGELPNAFLWSSAVILACYAAALIILGRKMFMRFQAADGVHHGSGLASGARFLPQTVVNWFRSRPRGAILNLIRREFHLLRTVWLLTLFSFCLWNVLILFHLVRPNSDEFARAPVPAGLAVILSFLIALLAGSLSLGEEKNWGTHAWQLTMPLSPSTQWAIKLSFSLCASVLCAVAIPLGVLMTYGWISSSPYSFLDHTPLWVWFVEALVATFLAFWCSCVVKGTVHAVLWCLPMPFAFALAGMFGNWLGLVAIKSFEPQVQTFLATMDPFKANRTIVTILEPTSHWDVMVIIAPLVAVALIQSHRMFRAHMENRKMHLVRSVLPLFAIVVLSVFVVETAGRLAWRLREQQTVIIQEAHLAIETLEANANRADLLRLQRFTADDLARSSPLSNSTQHWLRDSIVVVRPEAIRPGGPLPRLQWPYETVFPAESPSGKEAVSYSATIRTRRGSECNLIFRASFRDKNGLLFHSCQ